MWKWHAFLLLSSYWLNSVIWSISRWKHSLHLGNIVYIYEHSIVSAEVSSSPSPYIKSIRKRDLNSSVIFAIDLLSNHPYILSLFRTSVSLFVRWVWKLLPHSCTMARCKRRSADWNKSWRKLLPPVLWPCPTALLAPLSIFCSQESPADFLVVEEVLPVKLKFPWCLWTLILLGKRGFGEWIKTWKLDARIYQRTLAVALKTHGGLRDPGIKARRCWCYDWGAGAGVGGNWCSFQWTSTVWSSQNLSFRNQLSHIQTARLHWELPCFYNMTLAPGHLDWARVRHLTHTRTIIFLLGIWKRQRWEKKSCLNFSQLIGPIAYNS